VILNVSSAKAFQNCRRRWLYEYHLGRVPRKGARALEFGRLYHVVMELHLNGFPMGEAIEKASAMWDVLSRQADTPAERAVIADAVSDLSMMVEPLLQWRDEYPIEQTLEVEEPFEFEHQWAPGLRIRGRPDRVAIIFGKLFHVQNRTLAGSRDIGLYIDTARDDMHELLYAWALQKKYPTIPYGGTLFNIMKKLKYRGVATKRHPEGLVLHPMSEIAVQLVVPMLPPAVHQALVDIEWVSNEIERTIREYADGKMPARNRSLDAGPYQNALDPYLLALREPLLLADEAVYKDRTDPYQEAP